MPWFCADDTIITGIARNALPHNRKAGNRDPQRNGREIYYAFGAQQESNLLPDEVAIWLRRGFSHAYRPHMIPSDRVWKTT